MIIQTKIRNIVGDFTVESWVGEGGLADDYRALRAAEINRTPVSVVAEETDGYYNIIIRGGYSVEALSWYHLEGLTEDGRVVF
jgi:hypothetical protein